MKDVIDSSATGVRAKVPVLDRRSHALKTAAIVPAYNEEENIGAVLSVLSSCQCLDEVIVVSDGSVDNTVQVAQGYGVRVIELPVNVGKGGAMKAGSLSTDADVLLFIDADLIGLTEGHVRDLLRPVLSGEALMAVGVFEEGRLATDLAQKMAPFLSGQRAVHRSVMEELPDLEHSRYGVEVVFSRYAEKHHIPVAKVHLRNMAQVMKEEKMGLVKGFAARMRMYWEIIRAIR